MNWNITDGRYAHTQVMLHADPQVPRSRCTCAGPFYICIPTGQHIHIQCPVHGDVVLRGPEVTW